MRGFATRFALAVVLAAGACAAVPENRPLAPQAANVERRSIIPGNPDDPVILMAFSGGGSRAAALDAAVLRQLQRAQYKLGGQTRTLDQDVKVVSSVSGGSVTAAWFGLTGAEGLDALRDNFLVKDNMKSLELTGANPFTWFRLVVTGFTRVDALEELLDEKLFNHKTFKDLNAPDKPFIILNATDMASGHVFAFIPRRFDDICSDLDSTPITVGVAASAAFPILMSPVNFHNNSVSCPGKPAEAEWISDDLTNPYTQYLNLNEYRDARYSNDLRRGDPKFRDVKELHFLDGGVADNLGIGSLTSAIFSYYDDTGLLKAINDGKVNKLVVIVVNARSDAPSDLDSDASRPGLLSQLSSVTSVPIDAASASMEAQLSGVLTELAKAAAAAQNNLTRFAGLKVYGVTIDFDQLPAITEEERTQRDKVKQIPTLWTIAPDDLKVIDTVGPLLLNRDPCFRLLLKDLGETPTGDSPASDSACLQRVGPPS